MPVPLKECSFREKIVKHCTLTVGDHGVKIDTKSLKAKFHIYDLVEVLFFSNPGFKTGIARGIPLNFMSSKQGGQLFLK